MEEADLIRREIGDIILELTRGDISRQQGFDAVVNAANAELRIGGGVAGALHRAAGPGLEEEARAIAPIAPGEAVLTSGHALPNPWVIHVLGPVYGQDKPEERLLASCYREALRIAETEGFQSVAFPAISTGAFGYPLESAARVALGTVLGMVPELTSLGRIRFVLYDERALRAHAKILDELMGAEEGQTPGPSGSQPIS